MNDATDNDLSPHWRGFNRLWWLVAILLFGGVVLLWLLGYGPGGRACAVAVTASSPGVADTRAPAVTLNGPAVFEIAGGTAFVDPGAAAFDEADGEVEVATSGTVDSGTPGEYLLTYTATDAAGNRSEVRRTVVVTGPAPVGAALPEPARLYFSIGSAEFPADTELTLAPVISHLRTHDGAQAMISGFHDASGSLEFNQELAKRRARAVGDLLREAGIAADRILYETPAVTTGTGSPDEARRVEVRIKP